ncbi:hypothetical protein Pst134EB_004384 [Puccinia striiformis f. sp. tritici]|nr:hypothetical protein Pst134EB_004384 [Puccinia striiformis f. sp. tritici]
MPPQKAPTLTVPKTKKKKSILWDRDGVNGGLSSIEIILCWITTGKNYEKWRGDKEEGKSKVRLLTEINKLMNESGIFHREPRGIRQKIGELQKLYNKARDFLKNTGEGILAEDEENGVYTVEQKLHEDCPYWDQLDPVMEDPNTVNVEEHQPNKDDDSEGSELPDIDLRFIPPRAPTSAAVPTPSTSVPSTASTSAPPKKKKPKKNLSSMRPATRSSARASRIQKMTTEDLYMKSIVSKQQSEVTRARAEASEVKVAFMKELREHGLTLAEIECKVNAEFPPLADMDHDKGDDSPNESDDSL